MKQTPALDIIIPRQNENGLKNRLVLPGDRAISL